jgi:hypothetical protein
MTDLEEDWQDLRLRKPVVPTGELLEDLVEDWDVLQGKNSWFVGLYDPQMKLIPGSVIRVNEAQLYEQMEWRPVPCGGTVHYVGYWSRWKRIQFANLNETIKVEAGQLFGVKLQFHWATTLILISVNDYGSTSTNSFTFTLPSGTGTTNFSINIT